ncbi:MAG: hypothetical protein V5A39_02545 [Haloarculaceae archaeon]
MQRDFDREIEEEVVRVAAVTYFQGALGHAAGSLFFLAGAGCLWALGYPFLGWILVAIAFLLSANGFSIWAWDWLRAYFTPPDPTGSGPERTLTADPFSAESLVEMKSGAVMTLTFVTLLMGMRVALEALEPREVGALCVAGLVLGNLGALAWARFGSDR